MIVVRRVVLVQEESRTGSLEVLTQPGVFGKDLLKFSTIILHRRIVA
jgi:hypothetical protein